MTAPNISDGWVEWSGGECPAEPDALIEYRLRNSLGDAVGIPERAKYLCWEHLDSAWNDIIAYRLVQS